MTKKYKILAEFAKDFSYETPDVETYLQTKDNILKYQQLFFLSFLLLNSTQDLPNVSLIFDH